MLVNVKDKNFYEDGGKSPERKVKKRYKRVLRRREMQAWKREEF